MIIAATACPLDSLAHLISTANARYPGARNLPHRQDTGSFTQQTENLYERTLLTIRGPDYDWDLDTRKKEEALTQERGPQDTQ